MDKEPAVRWDRAGRLWVVCPRCGRKTMVGYVPKRAIFTRGRGTCRWCGAKWRLDGVKPHPASSVDVYVDSITSETKVVEGW